MSHRARLSDDDRFAKLPNELLKSEAVRTLPHAAFKVLSILAVGACGPGLDRKRQPGRNGVQALTDVHARRYGLNSRDTLYRSLQELIERGLIVRTREGWKSKNHFALYAVGWLPITHEDGQPLDNIKRAPDHWRSWKADDSEKFPSDGRTSSCPMVGNDRSKSRPIVGLRKPISRPIAGNTLRVSVHGTGSGPVSGSPSRGSRSRAVEELRSQIGSLHARLPHLTARDHARALKTDDVQLVRKILAEIKRGDAHGNDE
jgi:hypothetical protein